MSAAAASPSPERKRPPAALLLFCALLVFSAAALKLLPAPFAWISFASAAACLVAAAAPRRLQRRALWLNLGVIFLMLGATEWFFSCERTEVAGTQDLVVDADGFEPERYQRHATLGYAPERNVAARWKRFQGDRLVFDVTYTIDRHGLRTSPSPPSRTERCVVFLGGSFAFGAGVDDDETMPYLVGSRAPDVRAYNFAYSGYGPHQMLAALEFGVVDQILDCAPTHFVYVAIEDHVRRVAGKTSWGQAEPRYLLSADGTARYSGWFNDGSWTTRKLRAQLKKSAILQRIVFERSPTRRRDVELMLATVATARRFAVERYPGSEFHIIYWDADETPVTASLLAGFAGLGIPLHQASGILPRFREDIRAYELDAHDLHPNRRAHSLLADHVAACILHASERP